VVPGIVRPAGSDPTDTGSFLLALDGRTVAWTHGHGRRLWWTRT
jgi:hypothetical protein